MNHMSFLLFSSVATTLLLLVVVVLSTATLLVTATKDTSSKTNRISPCIWSRKIDASSSSASEDTLFSPSKISEEFNTLFKAASMFEAKNTTTTSSSTPFIAEAVVLSVFFSSSKKEQKSFTGNIDTILNLDNSFKLLPSGFVSEMQKRQAIIKNTCSLSKVLQLTLEVSVSDDDEKQYSETKIEKLFEEKFGMKSPILYTVLPSPARAAAADDGKTIPTFDEKLFINFGAAENARAMLRHHHQQQQKDNSNKQVDIISQFHFYKAELHPFVVFNFLTGGLQDIAILSAFDSSRTMKCVSSELEKIRPMKNNNKNKETTFKRRTPEEVLAGTGGILSADGDEQQNNNKKPFSRSHLVEAAENCIDTAFSKLKKVSSLSSMGSDRGAVLRTASSMEDILHARDEVDTPKRVVFVVNDAAVLPFLSALRSQQQKKDEEKMDIGSKMSSLILSAASEGRALFVWYRFEEAGIKRELGELTSKYNALSTDTLLSTNKLPSPLTRINNTLWGHYFRITKDDFEASPNVFVLSDSRIDDGVIPFRGTWYLAQSSQKTKEEEQSASEIYRETQKSIADGKASFENDEKNKNSKKSSKNSLLHPSTPINAVKFVRDFANPGRALQPIFPNDFNSYVMPFRYSAIFFVHTIGFDSAYNHEVQKQAFDLIGKKNANDYEDGDESFGSDQSLLHQITQKGVRTGALLPFKRRVIHFDGETNAEKQYFLVPLIVSNAILLGDVTTQLAVSTVVPCFLFFDRRDRRTLTDKKLFRRRASSFEQTLMQGSLSDPSTKLDHARSLVLDGVSIWKRAEQQSSQKSASNDFSYSYVQLDKDLVEEPTTMAGKIMHWIEEKIPVIQYWRVWMRIDQEEMLLCIGACILAFVIVVVLVFVFYLIRLPTSATFQDLVSGDKKKEEAAREKVRAVAHARANLGNPNYTPMNHTSANANNEEESKKDK